MTEKKFPEEGEILLGTVDRIIGTNVFIKLDDYGKEGVMRFSEVSPGRIRNIRKYVVPGQKIVCKVIRVNEASAHIDLSLRRVTTREKKEVLEMHKKEKDVSVMLGVVIKDKEHLNELIEKIKKKYGLARFLEEIMTKINKPEEVLALIKDVGFNDEESSKLLKLVSEKVKEKRVEVKEKIMLSSEAGDGIERIKKILEEVKKKAKVNYIGAPFYSLKVEDKEYKEANKKMKEIIDHIEKKAKELGCEFKYLKEKK